MKKFSSIFISLLAVLALLIMPVGVFAEETDTVDEAAVTANDVGLSYSAYIANSGWQSKVTEGNVAGTTGRGTALTAFEVESALDPEVLSVNYSAHLAGIGWVDTVSNGAICGTTDSNATIEAITISLSGEEAQQFDIYYRVHSANFGWLGWASNGKPAGTTGCGFAIEAFEIVVVPSNSTAPGSTDNSYLTSGSIQLSVATHVQGNGWTTPVNGGVSGTTGSALRIEAIDAKATDPTGQSGIIAQAYVENYGWQNISDVNTVVGTEGQGLRLEAVRFQLVGPAAAVYDLNYRTHVANIGWQGWTSNFQPAGTGDGALRIEAIEMNLVPKGAGASDANAYKVIATPAGIIPTAPECIVINIASQRMVYYQNYEVTADTGVVTGMFGIDNTLPGNWTVLEKLPNYRTKGPGYDAVVDYWLTLYVGDIYGFSGEGHIVDRVGIHDAGWRTDWRSNAYLTNGSHGCVNTPYAPMQYIYNTVNIGTPVIIR